MKRAEDPECARTFIEEVGAMEGYDLARSLLPFLETEIRGGERHSKAVAIYTEIMHRLIVLESIEARDQPVESDEPQAIDWPLQRATECAGLTCENARAAESAHCMQCKGVVAEVLGLGTKLAASGVECIFPNCTTQSWLERRLCYDHLEKDGDGNVRCDNPPCMRPVKPSVSSEFCEDCMSTTRKECPARGCSQMINPLTDDLCASCTEAQCAFDDCENETDPLVSKYCLSCLKNCSAARPAIVVPLDDVAECATEGCKAVVVQATSLRCEECCKKMAPHGLCNQVGCFNGRPSKHEDLCTPCRKKDRRRKPLKTYGKCAEDGCSNLKTRPSVDFCNSCNNKKNETPKP